MSKEELQPVYQAVELVSPELARFMDIRTEVPVFLAYGQDRFGEFGYMHRPNSIYQAGSVVDGRVARAGDKQNLVVYPDLETVLVSESVGFYGAHPFTGFVAVGIPVGEHTTETIGKLDKHLRTRTERMQVLGIRAFLNETQIMEGGVRQFPLYYDDKSRLVIDPQDGLDKGLLRYSFRILDNGEVEFRELAKPYRFPMGLY